MMLKKSDIILLDLEKLIYLKNEKDDAVRDLDHLFKDLKNKYDFNGDYLGSLISILKEQYTEAILEEKK